MLSQTLIKQLLQNVFAKFIKLLLLQYINGIQNINLSPITSEMTVYKGNNFLTKWKIKLHIQKSKSEQVFHHVRQHHNEWPYKDIWLFTYNFL